MAAVGGAVGGGCCGHPGLLPRCAVPGKGSGGLAGRPHHLGVSVVWLGPAPVAAWPADGVLADLVEALAVESLPDSARDTLTALYAYLERHRDHIDYAKYKDLGLPMGSEWSRVRVNGSSNSASRGDALE